MADYSWTLKRKAALDYLVQAQGSVRKAAELAQSGAVYISYSYLRRLAEEGEHRPFRDEYERRTGKMLSDLGITSEYVLGAIREDAESCDHAPTKLRAKELLGKWRGLFKDKQEIELSGRIGIDLTQLSDEQIAQLIEKTAN